MWNSIRTGSVLRSTALLVPAVLAVALLGPPATPVDANLLGSSAFRGATAGVAVPFDLIPLPPVVEGAHNDAALSTGYAPSASNTALSRDQAVMPHPAADPFLPDFDALVTGVTVIADNGQMNAVWNRLFDVPYNPGLFDFDTGYVVLVGGGQMHPYFGFDITNVERFQSTWNGPMGIGDTYTEEALAMVATTQLPGPAPPEMDPVWKVSAVEISIADRDDVILNRQVLALP